jgi:LacI family transcriptional regulator
MVRQKSGTRRILPSLGPKTKTAARRVIGKTKLQDVARDAKVSPATVSRVFNHPEIVRPEVREKVVRSIAELSYTRDYAARALKSRRSYTIGAVVPTLGISIFAEAVEVLQNRLSEYGYTLLIANSQYDLKKELIEVSSLIAHGVDGVVLVGDSHLPKLTRLLRKHGTPVVTTYVCKTRSGFPAIGIDNASASYDMTRYLLGLGHRNFGVIANLPASNDRSRARYSGILRALSEADLTLPASSVIEAAHSIAQGRECLRALIGINPSITAVVCTTDTLAIGALAEARAMGVRVPQALSITGFDDIEIASQCDPPLTTINVPAADIGREAADFLLGTFAESGNRRVTQLPYRLIIRGSTASLA